MSSDELIAEIIKNVERVFGTDGFGGTSEEYGWLLRRCGITEEEDNTWIDIIDFEGSSELDPANEDEAKIIGFLRDPAAVHRFLAALLKKYRNCHDVYPK